MGGALYEGWTRERKNMTALGLWPFSFSNGDCAPDRLDLGE